MSNEQLKFILIKLQHNYCLIFHLDIAYFLPDTSVKLCFRTVLSENLKAQITHHHLIC